MKLSKRLYLYSIISGIVSLIIPSKHELFLVLQLVLLILGLILDNNT